MDKFHPLFAEETSERLDKIMEYKLKNDLNHMKYSTSFIYKPSDTLM